VLGEAGTLSIIPDMLNEKTRLENGFLPYCSLDEAELLTYMFTPFFAGWKSPEAIKKAIKTPQVLAPTNNKVL
jgi:hypothetical protein